MTINEVREQAGGQVALVRNVLKNLCLMQAWVINFIQGNNQSAFKLWVKGQWFHNPTESFDRAYMSLSVLCPYRILS